MSHMGDAPHPPPAQRNSSRECITVLSLGHKLILRRTCKTRPEHEALASEWGFLHQVCWVRSYAARAAHLSASYGIWPMAAAQGVFAECILNKNVFSSVLKILHIAV